MNKNILPNIQFYFDQNLDEIISEKPINQLLVKDVVEKKITDQSKLNQSSVAINNQKIIAKNSVDSIKKTSEDSQKINFDKKNNSDFFIKSNSSNSTLTTSQAISNLAKEQTSQNKISQSFSLTEIVNSAKKIADKCNNIDDLREAVRNFDGCNLKKMATNLVFSDGNPNSKIMVIGEAPGNNEDLTGIPFCGDSGKLLDEMFAAINLTREKNLYISNVIFWRPPGNRKPTEEEIAICFPFVAKHIELIKPELIILVGATAMSAILKSQETISSVRGKIIDFTSDFIDKKIKIMTIFHPSYLMRQSVKKKLAWLDMLEIEQFLKSK
jgi:DNA polymerase